jgi:hypothetical protein
MYVFWYLLYLFSFLTAMVIGGIANESYTREKTVIDCITRPKECKSEYDYYQLKNKE